MTKSCVFNLFQAYIKIYQGEELPHPKSMLQVCLIVDFVDSFLPPRALKLLLMLMVCVGPYFYLIIKQLVLPLRPQQRLIIWQQLQLRRICTTRKWRRCVKKKKTQSMSVMVYKLRSFQTHLLHSVPRSVGVTGPSWPPASCRPDTASSERRPCRCFGA